MRYQQQFQNPAPKKNRTPIFIISGVVAVALIAALVIVLSNTSPKNTETGSNSPSAAADSPEAAQTIATNYLTALSEGRADDALALLQTSGIKDKTLLTNEVLADSLKRAPLTDIKVSDVSGENNYYAVEVSYTLGDTPTTDTLRVNTEEGKVTSILPNLSLSYTKGIDATVNGVAVKSKDLVSVFPGSYTMASANEYLEFTGETTTLLANSDSHRTNSFELSVSEAGIAMFREKVVPEAEACLASTSLDPGCGMALTDTLRSGTMLTDGTITRTQDTESSTKLQNVTPKVGIEVPTIISASGSADFGSFKIEADCTESGGASGRCDIFGFGTGTKFGTASIDLTDPELKVQWSNK
ncbi:MAG: hypothetical protein Q4D79_14865 [Propionibacteriaceae bacterium]|nr:hypothetical protein [Propionibacteriaceae bacterium]